MARGANRKLPPDDVLLDLLSSGVSKSVIAERYKCSRPSVTVAVRNATRKSVVIPSWVPADLASGYIEQACAHGEWKAASWARAAKREQVLA